MRMTGLDRLDAAVSRVNQDDFKEQVVEWFIPSLVRIRYSAWPAAPHKC